MIEGLLGAPIPCDSSKRVVFSYTKLEAILTPMQPPAIKTPKPGTWYWRNPGESPFIVCPRCGNPGRLDNHAVNSYGEINPSIACAMASCGDGVARCDAHYYGRLDGYMFAGVRS